MEKRGIGPRPTGRSSPPRLVPVKDERHPFGLPDHRLRAKIGKLFGRRENEDELAGSALRLHRSEELCKVALRAHRDDGSRAAPPLATRPDPALELHHLLATRRAARGLTSERWASAGDRGRLRAKP